MQTMQNQMFSIVQDIQKNVNEMHTDWKATGGFSSHAINDTKWIEVSSVLYFFLKHTRCLTFHKIVGCSKPSSLYSIRKGQVPK